MSHSVRVGVQPSRRFPYIVAHTPRPHLDKELIKNASSWCSTCSQPRQANEPYYWCFAKLGARVCRACHCVEARIRAQHGGAYALEQLHDVVDWSTSTRAVDVVVATPQTITEVPVVTVDKVVRKVAPDGTVDTTTVKVSGQELCALYREARAAIADQKLALADPNWKDGGKRKRPSALEYDSPKLSMLASEWRKEQPVHPKACWCARVNGVCICDMARIVNDPSVTKEDMLKCRKLWAEAGVL